MATKISIDFETYSEEDLLSAGAWRYSEHPSTDVLCIAYSIDGADPKLWAPHYNSPPTELFKAMEDDHRIYAWNALFEIAIWKNVCEKKLGWPKLDIEKVIDSMAIACSYTLPAKLKSCAEVLNTYYQKDSKGDNLIRKLSVPQKKGRLKREDAQELFDDLYIYCMQDVRTEMDILNNLPSQTLSDAEQEVWLMNLKSNLNGIKVDIEGVDHALSVIAENYHPLERKCLELTGGVGFSQLSKLRDWVASQGEMLEGLTKSDVDNLLSKKDLPSNIKEVLQIRKGLSKTSIAKYKAIKSCISTDNKVRGVSFYHGASTGRFAGRMVQLQNLPRGEIEDLHLWADKIKDMSLEEIEKNIGPVMVVFSGLIRSMFVSNEGTEFFVADYANIESRVLAWMAGQKDLIEAFEKDIDIYKYMASLIFNKEIDHIEKNGIERFIGKQIVLGCGYGMGNKKFQITCKNNGKEVSENLAEKAIKMFREKNNKIPNMWYSVEKMAIKAIKNKGTCYGTHMCKFIFQGNFLYIKLPSGRKLSYYKPILRDKKTPWDSIVSEIKFMGVDSFTKKWEEQGTYGGKLVENIVQGVARDLLVYGMQKIIEGGYTLITTIHDEIIAEREKGKGNIKEFENLMASIPPWGEGCPVVANGWKGERYRK